MSKEELRNFFKIANNYDDLQFLFAVIIYNAGPTIKNIRHPL